MRLELRTLAAAVVTGGLVGCATQARVSSGAGSEGSSRYGSAAEVARAAESLRGGTAGDVVAALGSTTVIRFDSGYEVWVYRYVDAAPRKQAHSPDGAPARPDKAERDEPPFELVMLFTPSGVVAKVRVRSPST